MKSDLQPISQMRTSLHQCWLSYKNFVMLLFSPANIAGIVSTRTSDRFQRSIDWLIELITDECHQKASTDCFSASRRANLANEYCPPTQVASVNSLFTE